MSTLEALRIALEAAIAALLAVVSLRLASAGRPHAAVLFLSALCGALAVTVALNALASAGVAPALRALNYFLDLASPALLLGFVVRAGTSEPPLRPADGIHLAVPAIGGLLLLSGVTFGPDAWMLLAQSSYLVASALAIRHRAEALRGLDLLRLAQLLVAGLGLVLALRIWVMSDARVLSSYRESAAYVLILLVVLSMATAVIWSMLSRPGLLGRQAVALEGLGATEAAILERRLLELLDSEALFLQPNLALADVAKRLETSPRHVSRVISLRMKDNFRGMINRRRAEYAARALADPRASVTTVMFDAGFSSKSAFQREFRRCHGMSPTEYRSMLDCTRETAV